MAAAAHAARQHDAHPSAVLYVTYFAGDEELGLEPDLEAKNLWLQHLPEQPWNEEAKVKLNEYFEKFVDAGINWVRKNGKEPVSTYDYQLVASLNIVTFFYKNRLDGSRLMGFNFTFHFHRLHY